MISCYNIVMIQVTFCSIHQIHVHFCIKLSACRNDVCGTRQWSSHSFTDSKQHHLIFDFPGSKMHTIYLEFHLLQEKFDTIDGSTICNNIEKLLWAPFLGKTPVLMHFDSRLSVLSLCRRHQFFNICCIGECIWCEYFRWTRIYIKGR